MSSSISAIYAVQPEAAQLPLTGSSTSSPVQTVAPAPETSGDVVTLSQPAQISQLSAEGENAATIAQTLGVSESLVDLDLGLVDQAASIPLVTPHAHAAAPAAAPAAAAPTVSTSSKA